MQTLKVLGPRRPTQALETYW
eukprot:SAG31_NODE_41208_length_277_cov_0.584270_1_plen_20_part_01